MRSLRPRIRDFNAILDARDCAGRTIDRLQAGSELVGDEDHGIGGSRVLQEVRRAIRDVERIEGASGFGGGAFGEAAIGRE